MKRFNLVALVVLQCANVAGAAAASRADHALTDVAATNRAARFGPSAPLSGSATQIYPWSEGALFRLFTAPGTVSDVVLEPGEALIAVAAGDTVRWVIGDTTSGAGVSKRVHVLVKPTASGLATNLIVTTDRRSYHLELVSTPRTAMAAISWTYPSGALLSLTASPAEPATPAPIDDTSGTDPSALEFDYVISGDNAAWRPLRVFDDGRQTFIEFPASIATGEIPPLFVLGPKNALQLVNYRLRGHFYVVDRLFAAAELRVGGKPQQVVRIVRAPEVKRGGRVS